MVNIHHLNWPLVSELSQISVVLQKQKRPKGVYGVAGNTSLGTHLARFFYWTRIVPATASCFGSKDKGDDFPWIIIIIILLHWICFYDYYFGFIAKAQRLLLFSSV